MASEKNGTQGEQQNDESIVNSQFYVADLFDESSVLSRAGSPATVATTSASSAASAATTLIEESSSEKKKFTTTDKVLLALGVFFSLPLLLAFASAAVLGAIFYCIFLLIKAVKSKLSTADKDKSLDEIEMVGIDLEKKIFENINAHHAELQLIRALMRMCTLWGGYDTENVHNTPIKDFFNEIFPGFGLDAEDKASGMAFTLLSLLYVIFLAIMFPKIYSNIKEANKDEVSIENIYYGFSKDLPDYVGHAIYDALLWLTANIASAALAFTKLSPEQVGLAAYVIFTWAIIFDTINTLIKHTRRLIKLNKEYNAEQNEEYKNILLVNIRYLSAIWVCVAFLGIGVFVGAVLRTTANAMTLIGNTAEIVNTLGFMGAWFIAGTAMAFCVLNFCASIFKFAYMLRELDQLANKIGATNGLQEIVEVGGIKVNVQTVIANERQIAKHEFFNDAMYTIGMLALLGVSMAFGGVPALIALSALVAVRMFYTSAPVCGKGRTLNDYVAEKFFNVKSDAVRLDGKLLIKAPEPAVAPASAAPKGLPTPASRLGTGAAPVMAGV